MTVPGWRRQLTRQGRSWFLLGALLTLGGASSYSRTSVGEARVRQSDVSDTLQRVVEARSEVFRYDEDEQEASAYGDASESSTWCCVDDFCQLERANPYADFVRRFYLHTVQFPYKEKANDCYAYLSGLVHSLRQSALQDAKP